MFHTIVEEEGNPGPLMTSHCFEGMDHVSEIRRAKALWQTYMFRGARFHSAGSQDHGEAKKWSWGISSLLTQ